MFAVSSRATNSGIQQRQKLNPKPLPAPAPVTPSEAPKQPDPVIERLKRTWEVKLAKEQAARQRMSMEIAAANAEIAALKAANEKRASYTHTYAIVERRACDIFGISRAELKGQRRGREIVFARQFVMYWAARLTKLSTPQIGRLMGGRDHTTCLYGKKAYRDKRAYMGRNLRKAR